MHKRASGVILMKTLSAKGSKQLERVNATQRVKIFPVTMRSGLSVEVVDAAPALQGAELVSRRAQV